MVQQDMVEPGGLLGLFAGISSPMPWGICGKMGKGSRVPIHVEGLQARLHAVTLGVVRSVYARRLVASMEDVVLLHFCGGAGLSHLSLTWEPLRLSSWHSQA